MLSRPELSFNRTLNVSRPRAFAIWIQPDHLRGWFRFDDCEVESITSDARPGGDYGWVARYGRGRSFRARGAYWEVVPDTRLLLHDRLSDFGDRPLFDALTMVDFHKGRGGSASISVRLVITETHKAGRSLPVSGVHDAWEDLLDRYAAYCDSEDGRSRQTPEWAGHSAFA